MISTSTVCGGTLVRSTHPDELRRAFHMLTGLLRTQINDSALAQTGRALCLGAAAQR